MSTRERRCTACHRLRSERTGRFVGGLFYGAECASKAGDWTCLSCGESYPVEGMAEATVCLSCAGSYEQSGPAVLRPGDDDR